MPNNDLQTRFEEYVNERQFASHLSIETIRGFSAVFTLFLRVMPEISSVNLLTSEMTIEFFRRIEVRNRTVGRGMIKSGVKSSTIKTYWSKLNSFFSWLHEKGHISAHPLREIKPPQIVYSDSRELEEMDIRKLYSGIALYSSNTFILRRDTVMVSLFALCGLRRGELMCLEVRDIDFEKRLLSVRGNTSKSKRTRYIPIHPTLLLHLHDYIAERNRRRYTTHHLIVSSCGDKGLSKHGLKHWVKSLNKKSGVRFHVHQFRHSFACKLARRDVNAVKIQKLLGHSSLDMTMTYLRSMGTEDMQADINRLSI